MKNFFVTERYSREFNCIHPQNIKKNLKIQLAVVVNRTKTQSKKIRSRKPTRDVGKSVTIFRLKTWEDQKVCVSIHKKITK